jgi:hypothetical protein
MRARHHHRRHWAMQAPSNLRQHLDTLFSISVLGSLPIQATEGLQDYVMNVWRKGSTQESEN